jgi:tight adherence protein B
MVLIIFTLIFISVGYFAYEGIPFLLRKHSALQKKQMEKTTKKLDRMFVASEGNKLLAIFVITPLVLGGVGFLVTSNPIGLIAGLVIGLIVPKIIAKNLSLLRRIKFQDQLVDGLMVLSSSLKAGMSLNQAFEILVEEMPAPISEEFSWVVKENRMGVALEDCLAHLRERMPLDDLQLIISAISVARETGGDLTEIFSQLVFTIRGKIKLERKVRALTVQGRLQGAIMSLLPIGFGIFIYYVSPENFNIMFTDKTGKMLMVWAVISECIGIILIKKLSKVEV